MYIFISTTAVTLVIVLALLVVAFTTIAKILKHKK